MSTYYARRRAAAALSFERPAGAAYRFTPASLQASGGLVTSWRDEVSGLVLNATGQIAYTAADARLGGQATAELTRSSHFDTFPLEITGSLTVAVVLKQLPLPDEFYIQNPLVLKTAGGAYSGFGNGEYGRLPNFNGRGYDLINNQNFDPFAPRAQLATFAQYSDQSTLRLLLNNVELAPLNGGVGFVPKQQYTASLGYLPADTRYGYSGLISYVEIFQRQLSEQELQEYAGWLNQQFDLTEINPY
jgi:hypothetical protein